MENEPGMIAYKPICCVPLAAELLPLVSIDQRLGENASMMVTGGEAAQGGQLILAARIFQ